jgi:glycosyltransferase involved in cell wall biosynthesis
VSTESGIAALLAAPASSAELPRFALDRAPAPFPGRVALLTNFLPPYRIRMLEMLSVGLRKLRIFVSVRMEGNRDWAPAWGILEVTVQRNLSFAKTFGGEGSFHEETTVHVPWDTIPLLVGFDPDVVVAAEFGMRTVQAAMYCWLYGKPLIVWATLSEVTERHRGRMRHALRRVLVRFASQVLVNGSSGARYIAGLGFPRESIHLVPQATENASFVGPAERIPGPETRLLYTGQLIERKGLDRMHAALLRWCAAHPERLVRWTIVGAGPLRETIAGWELPANYEVELLGALPFAELAAQYHAADVYVLPTLADEWGVVVNEAMIAGLPVLGSLASQAVLDMVVDGISGWTFDPDRPDELDAALARALAATPAELNAMRRAAIATAAPLDQRNMAGRILLALHAAAPSLAEPMMEARG